MTGSFTAALQIVLKEEGGFVHDARDPGGATNLGVTGRTWHSWSGQVPTDEVMRALTPAKVSPLYKALYWDRIGGDRLSGGLALVVFDFAVNGGPANAVSMLQGVVGAPRDGRAGPSTLRTTQTFVTAIGLAKLINRFCDARRDYYASLQTFPVFGRGWLARVERVQKEALTWAG